MQIMMKQNSHRVSKKFGDVWLARGTDGSVCVCEDKGAEKNQTKVVRVKANARTEMLNRVRRKTWERIRYVREAILSTIRDLRQRG